jgi:hypothetical protein
VKRIAHKAAQPFFVPINAQFLPWKKVAQKVGLVASCCSDKGYEGFKGLFQSVEYIHRRTQMITARVAAAVTFYRIESSAL